MIDWSDLKLPTTYDTATVKKLWSADLDRRHYASRGMKLSTDWLKLKQGWKSYLSNYEDIPFITTENSADDITKAEHEIFEFSNANHLIRKAAVTGVFPDDSASKDSDPTAEIDDFLSGIKRKETTT